MTALPFSTLDEVAAAIPATMEHLGRGGVIACPTETVYGLGSGTRDEDLERLAMLKTRPVAKPFLLLVSSRAMAVEIGLRFTPEAEALAEAFWPGPLTLVLPGGEGRVSEALRGGTGGVAVRLTAHPGVRELVRHLGHPITSTSANRSGRPAARAAAAVMREFGSELECGRLLLLDGGKSRSDTPSTVVDCVRQPRLVRVGAISRADLRARTSSLAS